MAAASEPRRLEADGSQAARSPAALHDDALSPTKALEESVGFGGGQRVGDGLPVAGPITTFSGPEDDVPDTA